MRGMVGSGRFLGLVTTASSALAGCASERSFGEDVAFLREHGLDAVVLGEEPGGPRVVVVPEYQGRVMTSTAGGEAGRSYGWINSELIASGEFVDHINPFGGEDRFWLGPEGGQYALYFSPGSAFVFEDWQTPSLIDTETYPLVERTPSSARFRKSSTLSNYAGTEFRVGIDREVVLLDAAGLERAIGDAMDGVRGVGYETRNVLRNEGDEAWTKDGGLLSIWILGMYKPGDEVRVVIPFRKGTEEERGVVVNDDYFGKVPSERLKVGDGVVYFKGDGIYRSKIGLSPRRAMDVCGSWDAQTGTLTIVQYNQPDETVRDYVNSAWALQDEPYGGDVINSYNDGSTGPGEPPLGPFYELETSSPALALQPGESYTHVHRTLHLEGDRAELDRIARRLLGVGLDEIEAALE